MHKYSSFSFKTAKHSSDSDSAKTVNTFQSQENTCKTMSIDVWHRELKGHPFPVPVTVEQVRTE